MRKPEEVKIGNRTLAEVLERHKHWLDEDCEGWEDMRANLRGADLSHANLSHAVMNHAVLSHADMNHAVLSYADLRGADLSYADLSYADLSYAVMADADMARADMQGAKNVPHIPFACPSDGAFIGWKKCRLHGKENGAAIVKLLIPEDARRLSATGRKCRCDKAVVLEVQDMEGNVLDASAYSTYIDALHFKYKAGETVTPEKPFDGDRWNECSTGIHFFINREEAVDYVC